MALFLRSCCCKVYLRLVFKRWKKTRIISSFLLFSRPIKASKFAFWHRRIISQNVNLFCVRRTFSLTNPDMFFLSSFDLNVEIFDGVEWGLIHSPPPPMSDWFLSLISVEYVAFSSISQQIKIIHMKFWGKQSNFSKYIRDQFHSCFPRNVKNEFLFHKSVV